MTDSAPITYIVTVYGRDVTGWKYVICENVHRSLSAAALDANVRWGRRDWWPVAGVEISSSDCRECTLYSGGV